MALAIDGSTPAVATSSTATVTNSSFTPPDGSLTLNLWSANSHTGRNPDGAPSITDNLGVHLTYTLTDWQSRADSPTVDGQAAGWSAPVGTGAAMTVSVTNGVLDPEKHAALQTIVFTGQDSVAPIGAHGKSGSASAASIAQNYVGTASGSWGFIVVTDWDALGDMTAGSGCTVIATGTIPTTQISYGFVRRTTADGTNGGTTTLNVNLAGTSTHVNWAYVEVVPAATSVSAGAPEPPLPPYLIYQLALAALRGVGNVSLQIDAQTATDGPGLASFGTAVHVGKPSGVDSAGVSSTGTAKKVVALSATCSAGAASTGTAKKVVSRTGVGFVGVASTGTAVTKRARTGIVSLGAAPAGTQRTVRARAGLSSTGLAGIHSGVQSRAVAGVAWFGGAGSATAVHKALPNGRAAAGLYSHGLRPQGVGRERATVSQTPLASTSMTTAAPHTAQSPLAHVTQTDAEVASAGSQ